MCNIFGQAFELVYTEATMHQFNIALHTATPTHQETGTEETDSYQPRVTHVPVPLRTPPPAPLLPQMVKVRVSDRESQEISEEIIQSLTGATTPASMKYGNT